MFPGLPSFKQKNKTKQNKKTKTKTKTKTKRKKKQKKRSVYPTLTWAVHAYQNCVLIHPGGQVEQNNQKWGHRVYNILKKLTRKSCISDLSVPPGLAVSLTTRMPCTHYSAL